MARSILRRRLKSNFKSTRAAWLDIAKDTGTKASTHHVKPAHTRTHYVWSITKR